MPWSEDEISIPQTCVSSSTADNAGDRFLARAMRRPCHSGASSRHRERSYRRPALARAVFGACAPHSIIRSDGMDPATCSQGVDESGMGTCRPQSTNDAAVCHSAYGRGHADEFRSAGAVAGSDPCRSRRVRPNAAPGRGEYLDHQRHHFRAVVLGLGPQRSRDTRAYGPRKGPISCLRSKSAAGLPEFAMWSPGFFDYVFLAFTNATAFSPADTFPLTARAKMLMMAEAVISLVTIALVASRAVGNPELIFFAGISERYRRLKILFYVSTRSQPSGESRSCGRKRRL